MWYTLIQRRRKVLPAFVYYTYSNKSDFCKCRFLFKLNRRIECKDEYAVILNSLNNFFGLSKIDIAIKEISSIKNGIHTPRSGIETKIRHDVKYTSITNTPYYTSISDHYIIDQQCIKDVAHMYYGTNDTSEPYTNYENVLDIDLLNSYYVVDKSTNDINNISRHSKNFTKRKDDNSSITPDMISKLKEIDVNILKSKCQLFEKSFNTKLSHSEGFHLINNINYFNDDLQSILINNLKSKDNKNWNYYSNYSEDHNYLPSTCKSYCQYYNNCKCHSIVDKMLTLKPKSTLKLEDQQRKLMWELIRLYYIKQPDNKIHIVKANVGLGKSFRFKRLYPLNMEDRNFTIAFSNHQLKDECYNDYLNNMRDKYVKIENYKTIEIPTTIDNYDDVKRLLSIGDYDRVKEILEESAEGREYLLQNKKHLHNKIIFTTFEKLITCDNLNNITIIDEDPLLDTIFKSDVIDIAEIEAFKKYLLSNNMITEYNLVDNILTSLSTTPIRCNNNITSIMTSVYKNFVKTNRIYTNLSLLWTSTLLCKQVKNDAKADDIQTTNQILTLTDRSYIFKKYLSDKMNKKMIIIQSATINTDFYKQLFGEENVIEHRIDDPELIIDIEQDMSRSFAKWWLNSKDGQIFLDELIKESDENEIGVLTHKALQPRFKTNLEKNVPHKGNVNGYNNLQNEKETWVLSKLVLPAQQVQMIASCLDNSYMPSTNLKTIKSKQTIDINGNFKRNYYTYNVKVERDIDLWFTNQDLVQSIGRSRPFQPLIINGQKINKKVKIYTDMPSGF